MSEKILVVDDDPNLAEVMKRALSHAGFQVVIAKDGKQAIRTFYEQRPDLVILDVVMPYLNGFEVCQRIREMADTPILMLTAKDSEDDQANTKNHGWPPPVYLARPRESHRRRKTAQTDNS